MPFLSLIAGPNGAGKSTTSELLLKERGITSFDFDKEFYGIWGQFSFDPFVEEGARNRTIEIFEEEKIQAINSRQNFSFETNFHNMEMLLPHINQFRSNGYDIELIFLFLKTPEQAIERVKQRVALGGHSVPEDEIRKRFSNGLMTLDGNFQMFDSATFYLSEDKSNKLLIAFFPKISRTVIDVAPIPEGLIKSLPKLIGFIKQLKG